MAPHQDPVVRHARRNLGPVVAFVLLFLAVSAMGYGLWKTYDKADTVETQVEAAGPPCVDENPGPAIRPSEGCKAFFSAIVTLCAENPTFCERSQRRAARVAQDMATAQSVGRPLAVVVPREGGGGSKGNNPNSPTTPSPDQGGGDQGQPGKPEQPSPGQPDNPGQPTNPEPPGPTDGPLIDVPKILEPVCKFVPAPLGGVVRICQP